MNSRGRRQKYSRRNNDRGSEKSAQEEWMRRRRCSRVHRNDAEKKFVGAV